MDFERQTVALEEVLHNTRMQSEGTYLLLCLFFRTLDVCQLLGNSYASGWFELFTN